MSRAVKPPRDLRYCFAKWPCALRGIGPNAGIPPLTPVGPVVIVAPLSGGPDLSLGGASASVRISRYLLPAQCPFRTVLGNRVTHDAD